MINKQLQSKNQATRKLDRRNAIKNIDYHATSSTSPSSLDGNVTIPSFRVEGVDGDIDLICRSLGLSGPEDFAIPAADWEARKSSSSVDRSPQGLHNRKLRSCELGYSQNSEKLRNDDNLMDAVDAKVRVKGKERTENGFNNRNLRSRKDREIGDRVRDGNETKCELGNDQSLEKFKVIDSKRGNSSDTFETKFRVRESNRNGDGFTAGEIGVRVRDCGDVACELINHRNSEKFEVIDRGRDNQSETLGRNFRVRESKGNESVAEAKIEVTVKRTEELRNPISVRSFRSGINGARPPVLAPPPVISPTQQTDNTSSSWDLLRSFGPPSDGDSGSCITTLVEKKGTGGNTEGVEKNRLDDKVISESDTSDANNVMVEHLHYVSPLGKFKCTINSWQKGDFLGSGSFGTVYEGFTDDGIFFAVKEVSLLDQGDQGRQSIYQLEQEIFFLSQFEHENIVQYLGTDKDNGKFYIFLELVTKGSLASLYQKYNLQDSQVSAYTRQILNGLNYLHLRKVVHRDIKCANILVDASGSVKLADFGLAKATNLNDVKSCKGTAFWMAPEVVNRKKHGYGLAADIWSLGCTVLEMLTRRIPYSHLEGMQALFRIGKGEPPPIPNTLSSESRDFISKCLQVDPDHRPTAAQLLDHPFVKRPLPIYSAPASPFHHGRRL